MAAWAHLEAKLVTRWGPAWALPLFGAQEVPVVSALWGLLAVCPEGLSTSQEISEEGFPRDVSIFRKN